MDDLVSLYEIVSEQMNPFVGLSKVTKKRIEALENFTKELDTIKNRLDDVESEISTNKLKPIETPIIEIKSNKPENNEIIKKDFEKEFDNNLIEKILNDSFIDNIIEEIFIKNIK